MRIRIRAINTIGTSIVAAVMIASLAFTSVFGNMPIAEAAPVMAQEGAKAPESNLKGLDGKTYTVGRGNGKIQLLSFWASWCDPCRMEAPMLNELASKYKTGLDVYGINVTKYDRQEDVRKFVQSLKLTYPILLDKSGDVFDIYRGAAFPTSVLIDGKGTVREVLLGVYSKTELEEKIQKLIEESETK
ncbi:TlpA family protein disulfide reductase [Paenibacillus sp. P96]|uniref:TlpA family protein disulfide reductase n=1 Tax=Paenibacillus zeirhizosphaerae TaxID=2987519 RepID=A0ABT9FSM8_9BACL|nr:TlpA disulfide reductase family protein [Paenibacillus sp. P96]MDP4097725.1 TlpA family protein disulfide reductase [Paenibacillus sp. P96]